MQVILTLTSPECSVNQISHPKNRVVRSFLSYRNSSRPSKRMGHYPNGHQDKLVVLESGQQVVPYKWHKGILVWILLVVQVTINIRNCFKHNLHSLDVSQKNTITDNKFCKELRNLISIYFDITKNSKEQHLYFKKNYSHEVYTLMKGIFYLLIPLIFCQFYGLYLFIVHFTAVPGLIVTESLPVREAVTGEPHRPSPLVSRASLSAEEILARVEVAKLGESTSGGSAIDIQDVINAGELTEEKRKEIAKALVEKHMLESVALENKLRGQEIQSINEVLTEIDNDKQKAVKKVQASLKESLENVQDEGEREEVIMKHADELEAVSVQFADRKERSLKNMRDRLKKDRLKQKKSLFK